MSDENRFFRFVWRLNAVLLIVVGFGFLVIQGSMLLDHFDVRLPLLNRPVPGEAMPFKAQDIYFLTPTTPGNYASLDSERLDTLQRAESYGGIVINSRVVANVNILVTDKKTAASHWMFQGNNRSILSTVDVLGKDEGGEGLKMAAIALVVAEADSNHDGQIDDRDRVSLYVYFNDGKAPRKLFTADRIIPSLEGPVEKWLVYYQDGDSTFAAYFKIPGFELVTKTPIPGMPKLAQPSMPSITKIGFTGLDQYME